MKPKVELAIQEFNNIVTANLDSPLTSKAVSQICSAFNKIASTGIIKSYAPLLPLFLTLKGKPYNIYSKEQGSGFFPLEPMFKSEMPFRAVWKCGRQISKSTSLSAQGFLQSITTNHFSTLFVTPLFEMTRRLSSNYVKPFIDSCPVKDLVIDSNCNNSVLQRTFANHSSMFFTFAFLDCERARGISADKLIIDESQNLDWDFIGVLRECMSASRYGVSQYSGTPKTVDNTIEKLWQDSSMAEFCIKCEACNYWNIPNIENHVLKMIRKNGLVCAKCERLINPQKTGVWTHQQPDRKNSFAGYHVPQIIMPMHYELPHKWAIIWDKYNSSRVSQTVFYNECLGESCDVGSKLLTTTDIKNASVSTIKNELEKVTDTSFLSQFTQITMGVDWGGQTAPVGRNKLAHMAEDMAEAMSYTTIAIVGQWSTGKQQCIYAYRFPLGVNHMDETTTILNLYRRFRCRFLAHDFGGSGAARETILVQAGLDSNVIIPLLYIGNSTKNFIVFQPADESRPRNYWSLDKSRSLVTLCLALKQQQVFLPEYESAKDVTSDLLALMEDKVERPGSADILRVVRQPKSRDDFAHSLNYACVSNWHSTDSWPRFAAAYSYGAQTSEDNPTNAEY